jgi:hypothetical protein
VAYCASSVPIVTCGGGEPPWASSSIGSSRAGSEAASRFFGILRFAAVVRSTDARFLGAGPLLAAGRLAPVRPLLGVRRFEVVRRFATVRRFVTRRFSDPRFFRDDREPTRFFRFAMSSPRRGECPRYSFETTLSAGTRLSSGVPIR